MTIAFPPSVTSDSELPQYASGSLCIYFFGTDDGEEIKIGKTSQPIADRHAQLALERGRIKPIKFLAGVLGQSSDEAYLKRHFKLGNGEWKKATPELIEYVRWLRDQPYVGQREEDVAHLPLMSSTAWLPGAPVKSLGRHQKRLFENDATLGVWADHFSEADITKGDFYSPIHWIEAARLSMGSIDLDPATCKTANDLIKATEWFDEARNGLAQPWYGRVWLNPPFGMWQKWTRKASDELKRGEITQMCVLLSTRTLTATVLRPLLSRADALFIEAGRAKFWGPKTVNHVPNYQGHSILYFGDSAAKFRDVFGKMGTVFPGVTAWTDIEEDRQQGIDKPA